ncbi:ZIP family metal transporter [Bacillus testis]|uniref:ZIP family metal transporter n=1 Tax=Bacillus testis TaxID=1622072 RepID=UPI00067F3FF0|nr:ZIP family metal transporter [Bacillus testis]
MPDLLLGSFCSAMSTGLGAFIILFVTKSFTHRFRDILLAFTAGIMMSACMMGLIPEAMELGGFVPLVIGIYFGVATLTFMEKNIPHIDVNHSNIPFAYEQKAMLIIMAITLHNIPEGLSVGVSYASPDTETGNLIAMAIGLQNAPEGFLVALFLLNLNISKWKAFIIAAGTGTIEIAASLVGYTMTTYIQNLIPIGLAFAAGAMLFIIYKELIPESHGDGNERAATFSFIAGLLVMVMLMTSS